MGEDMEIRNIITFVRIAELQNFSKAAEQLGYSQSAVTMQIKQLEAELNTQLFERIGKRIKLTQAGSRLLPYALAVLDAVRQAEDITREPGNLTGKLRIGTAESLLISVLPPIIIEFSRLCPHVELSTHTPGWRRMTPMFPTMTYTLLPSRAARSSTVRAMRSFMSISSTMLPA